MKIEFNRKKFLALSVMLISVSTLMAQEGKVLTQYNGEAEIKDPVSVTLKSGFFIPKGQNVRIHTGPSFDNNVLSTWSPSINQNYIRSRVFKMPGVNSQNIDSARNTGEVNQTVQYIDGLGRVLQAVTVQGSPGFKDLVQPMAYDAFGREQFKYLPYPSSLANGSFRPASITEQKDFYNNPAVGIPVISNAAFSEIRFENSPLNRVLEQGAPGASWQLSAGHTQKMSYGSNITGEVKLWQINAGGASVLGPYAPGKLYKTVVRDENTPSGQKAGSVEDYKDFNGQVVLKRIWESDVSSLSTYYVYDKLGNLRYVIPPILTQDSFTENDEAFKNYIYGYHYDGRRRLTEKKIPGKGWEFMVYNKLDQLVLSQDEVQRVEGKWLFYKYDGLGRVVITGIYVDGSTLASMQLAVNSESKLWETKSSGGIGYTNLAFPRVISYYHSINYYDNYEFPESTLFPGDTGLGLVSGERTNGLLTASRVTVLGTGAMLLTVNYYDVEGRLVQVKSQNHLGGTDVVTNGYNFAGELKTSVRNHTASGTMTTISNQFVYDHMGRKKVTLEQINGGAEVVLSKLDYNELGQLRKKNLHSIDQGTTFLQNTVYDYNERGWLKRSTSDQLGMELQYQDGAFPQFNGNISGQRWGTGTTYSKAFTYAYDGLNRLLSANSTGVNMNEVLTYDVMGNISSLNRDGLGSSNYSYTGNRLNQISNGPLATGLYSYDKNGNAIVDGRNGLNIGYNYLNLPISVTRVGLDLAYTYNSQGEKLQKVSNGEVRKYADGIEYAGNTIDIIHTEEGLARNNNGVFSYEYNLSDHLGNVRYSFRKNPETGNLERLQSDDYYAFGLRKSSGSPISVNNKYLYNGKEIQDELGGLYDYGARFYDPVIGRWNVIDPLAEKMKQFSPYVYGNDNPVHFIDPDGMLSKSFLDDIWNKSSQSGTTWTNSGDASFSDGNGNTVADQQQDPTKTQIGDKVYERGSSFVARFWYTIQPRIWTDPGSGFRYKVDADGKIDGYAPYGGAGGLEFLSGGGVSSFLKYNPAKLKTLISTEKGAQSVEKVASIAQKMKANDPYVFAEPIYTYMHKGKTYILDGHNRIKAAILNNQTINVIELNASQAMRIFKSKVQEIQKGLF